MKCKSKKNEYFLYLYTRLLNMSINTLHKEFRGLKNNILERCDLDVLEKFSIKTTYNNIFYNKKI